MAVVAPSYVGKLTIWLPGEWRKRDGEERASPMFLRELAAPDARAQLWMSPPASKRALAVTLRMAAERP